MKINFNDARLLEQLYKRYGKHNLLNEIATANPNANTPKVYVGTYAKYNDGNLKGEWVELDDFSDYDDFIEYCMELHSDEDDPELMFQDWENIPDKFISESHISEEFWDMIEFYNEYGYEFINDIINERGLSDVDEIRDALDNMSLYYTDSIRVAIEMHCDETLAYESNDFCERYFDYEQYGRDIRVSGDLDYELEDIDDEDERKEREDELYSMSDYEIGEYFVNMCGSIEDAVGKNRMEYYIDYDAVERDFGYDITFVESEINGKPVVAFIYN